MGGWIPVVVLKSGIRFVVGDSWSLRFAEVADLLNRENQERSQSSLLDPHGMILLQIEAGVSHDIPTVRIYRSTGKSIGEVAVATGFAVSAERLKTAQFSFSKDKKKMVLRSHHCRGREERLPSSEVSPYTSHRQRRAVDCRSRRRETGTQGSVSRSIKEEDLLLAPFVGKAKSRQN